MLLRRPGRVNSPWLSWGRAAPVRARLALVSLLKSPSGTVAQPHSSWYGLLTRGSARVYRALHITSRWSIVESEMRPAPPWLTRDDSRRQSLEFRARLAGPLPSEEVLMSQPGAMAGVKNVVLVHGGFVDGSGWEGVYKALKKEGYTVAIVQNPTTSLADDVAVTKRTIAAQDGPVILVGHSYGGAVITEAGSDPKVAGLVYVA